MKGEAERSLAELQALLEARTGDLAALEAAGTRVERALRALTRATPPAELARVADLFAIVRESTARRRDESGLELERVREGRARLARLADAEGAGDALDLEA
ncbi:MAG: hypothetical protein JNK02_08115 [Planctomycetes bacterium]|nr:hypothetical protein [Planctomycetota bacterium]